MLKQKKIDRIYDDIEYEKIINGSIKAIELEIKAIEKSVSAWGGDKPASVVGGYMERQAGESFYYVVDVKDSIYPPEWTDIELCWSENGNTRKAKGNILKHENRGSTLYFVTEEKIDMKKPDIIINFETTYVLEMMLNKLRKPLPNPDTIRKTLGVSNSTVQDVMVSHPSFEQRNMNEGQRAAACRVSGSEVALVFGPPGTGKTSLLGCITADMAENQNKRVLVTAHTNIALDTALSSICLSSPEMAASGQIIRKGALSKEFAHLNISEKKIQKNPLYTGNPSVTGATLSQLSIMTVEESGAFDVVIIDESSMASIPQIIIAASYSKGQVINMGDPKQLLPVSKSKVPAAKEYMKKNIFMHLGQEDPAVDIVNRPILTQQYRMEPKICEFVSTLFYSGRLTSAKKENKEKRRPDLVLLDTNDLSVISKRSGDSSRVNEGHANIVRDLVSSLAEEGEKDVGIINPFLAQSKLIKEKLMESNRGFFRNGGQLGTIHKSQGGEKEIIILDTVDAGHIENMSSFLDDQWNDELANLLCVGLSRAKSQLIIVANTKSFRQKYGKRGHLIMKVLEDCYRIGEYVKPSKEDYNAGISRVAGTSRKNIRV